MTPFLRSTPVPGTWVPAGAKTPIMPARAFGAPQTTWTGSPSPGSTMQTRSRSAFGCGSAETTRAMRKGAKSLVRSSTPSTSRPIMVSRSAMPSTVAMVSRCSFSQDRVNFMSVRLRGPAPARGHVRPRRRCRWWGHPSRRPRRPSVIEPDRGAAMSSDARAGADATRARKASAWSTQPRGAAGREARGDGGFQHQRGITSRQRSPRCERLSRPPCQVRRTPRR